MKKRYIQRAFVLTISIIFIANTILALPQSPQNLQPRLSSAQFDSFMKTAAKPQEHQPLTIMYPRFSCPVILQPSESFDIEIDIQEFDQAYIYLETANEPVTDTYWLSIDSQLQNVNTIFSVTIPDTIPVEMYNLTIFIEEAGNIYAHTQPHAISIVDEITNNYSFIQVSDLHLGDIRGITESFYETIGWKSIKRCIAEINILNPDFVVITGDLVFGQLYPFEFTREYRQLYEILQLFDMPIYLVPGNHDGYNRIFEDGLEFWTRYFGPHYYSFDYGSSHFQVINSYDQSKFERLTILFIPLNWGGSISNSQLEWIEQDLENSRNSEINFMLIHHNPLWETTSESLMKKTYENRAALLDLIDENNIDMILAGHVHYDNVTIINDTIFVTTTTPESTISTADGYWGYRRITIENGSISSYNYKEPKYSIPTYKLDTEIINAFSKKVINDLDIPISAYLKFILPKGNYSAQNGLIIYQRQNEILSELYIKTTVSAQNNKIVTLQPI